MNKVVLKSGLWRDWQGDGVAVPPVGVSLIISNGLGAGPCHELALSVVRDSLVSGKVQEATVFSRGTRVKGRFLSFAGGSEGGGLFNGWRVSSKDVQKTVRSLGRDSAWNDGCSLQYVTDEIQRIVHKELGWFGSQPILLDVEFADLTLVAGLNELARKRKKRIFVTTTFPLRTDKGNLTLPAVELAAQTACGTGLDELAEAVVCIQSRQPNGVNMDAVVEVLKGQFFAARAKVEHENLRKRGLIAMARSLLNGFV